MRNKQELIRPTLKTTQTHGFTILNDTHGKTNKQLFHQQVVIQLATLYDKNSVECYVAPALCLHIRDSMKASE